MMDEPVDVLECRMGKQGPTTLVTYLLVQWENHGVGDDTWEFCIMT